MARVVARQMCIFLGMNKVHSVSIAHSSIIFNYACLKEGIVFKCNLDMRVVTKNKD